MTVTNNGLTSAALPAIELKMMGKRINQWHKKPSFHLVYPVFAHQLESLSNSLKALNEQIYTHFGVSVISTQTCPDKQLFSRPNFQWLQLDEPFNYLNSLIHQVDSDWVMLLLPGDLLVENALFNFAEYINFNKHWLAIYADEDQIYTNKEGVKLRHKANFKPNFNYELLLSTNYLGGCVALRKDAIQALGGLTTLPYLQNEDMLLRLGVLMTRPAIGHLPFISNSRSDALDKIFNSVEFINLGANLRLEHLAARGLTGIKLVSGLTAKSWQIKYPLPTPTPKVALLMPILAYSYLEQQLTEKHLLTNISNLIEKTSYPNWQLYIGISEDLAGCFSQEFLDKHSIQLVNLAAKTTYVEALNYLAIVAQTADFYCLVEADLFSTQDYWLENLVSHGMKLEVGLVAPKLIKPNGQIFGVGQVLGMNASVSDLYANLHLEQDLNNQTRAWCDQNFSALNSSCILISKDNFFKFGLNKEFSNTFYLTDLGLRMQQAGLRLHWTPHSVLISQGVSQNYKQAQAATEIDKFYNQWFDFLIYDPVHNLNLQLTASGNQPNTRLIYNWHPIVRDQPRILILPLYLTSQQSNLVNNLSYFLDKLEQQEKLRVGNYAVNLLAQANDLPHIIELARASADLIICIGEEPKKYVGKLAKLKALTGIKLGVYISEDLAATHWQGQEEQLDFIFTSIEQPTNTLIEVAEGNFVGQSAKAKDKLLTFNLPLVEDLNPQDKKVLQGQIEEFLFCFLPKTAC